MKFTIESKIAKSLSQFAKVTPNNPILPVLENLHISVEGKSMVVTASDLKSYVRKSFPLIESDEDFVFLAPFKVFVGIFSAMAEQPATIEYNPENFGIKIVAKKEKFSIVGENPSDFPKSPFEKADLVVSEQSINLDLFKSQVEKVLFCCDSEELQPTSCLWSINGSLYCTDRFIGAKSKNECTINWGIEGSLFSSIVPFLGGESAKVKISTSCLFFEIEDSTEIAIALSDKTAPPFEPYFIPVGDILVEVDRSELATALSGLSVIANPKYINKLKMEASQGGHLLKLSLDNVDYSQEGVIEIPADIQGEGSITIGQNLKLFNRLIGNIGGKSLVLQMSYPDKPTFIRTDDFDELYLAMPIGLG